MDFNEPFYGGRLRRSILPKEQRSPIDFVAQWVIEMEDPKLRKLWHRPTTNTSDITTTSNRTTVRDYPAHMNDKFDEYIRFKNQRDSGEEDTQNQKKSCSWPTETTTETTTDLHIDVEFENSPQKGDQMEQVDDIYRKRRSVDEDVNDKLNTDLDDEEAVLAKIGFLEEINRLVRWWNVMRVRLAIAYLNMQNTGQSNKFKPNQVLEMPAVPTPDKFLKYAASQCVSNKVALITWRSLERTHRRFEAAVNYTAHPGNKHPDTIMKDFDQTFKDIEYDFNPQYPEGTVDDPTAYRVLTLPNGNQEGPRYTRRLTWERKKAQAAASKSASTDQKNSFNVNQRIRRSSLEENQKQHAITKFTWRCEMAVVNDDKELQENEIGAKFLTYGGRIVEKNVQPGNEQ